MTKTKEIVLVNYEVHKQFRERIKSRQPQSCGGHKVQKTCASEIVSLFWFTSDWASITFNGYAKPNQM